MISGVRLGNESVVVAVLVVVGLLKRSQPSVDEDELDDDIKDEALK